MSIYSVNDPGTTRFRTRFVKSISNKMRYDCGFHDLIPILKRFCLPGDVWRIAGNALVRFLPMVSPSMTSYNMIVRYFFVPLRLIEENTELIITGSVDGKLYESELPVFDNFVTNANKGSYSDAYLVKKHRFWDYMNVQVGDYENIKDSACLPANYWWKGYCKIWWDFYRDENYSLQNFDDFDDWIDSRIGHGCDQAIFQSLLRKDYFTSVLPWQLKATAKPTLDVTGTASFIPNFDFGDVTSDTGYAKNNLIRFNASTNNGQGNFYKGSGDPLFGQNTGSTSTSTDDLEQYVEQFTENFSDLFTSSNAQITGLGFNADELRTMMAQTRIFERLARTGSRYTEYLYSNFGISPADGTLQRPQYLGGWKIPIVTSEVLQTAADGANPVGTMRGHGITRGGNTIKDFYCKEFGLLFGLAEVRPNVEYTTGIPRQLTYKSRFEFFNPSFQHLSEQEVRNGEVFVNFTPDSDGNYDNDVTFGFQAYANELRSSNDEVVGDMRDSLSYWGSELKFANRPNALALRNPATHGASFNRPFVANTSGAKNIIVDFANILDVYRPMVRYATPGLVDHF